MWLIVLLGLLLLGEGLAQLLILQQYPYASMIVWLLGYVITITWLIFGLFFFRQVPWVHRTSQYIGITASMYLIGMICYSLGYTTCALGIAGVWAMAMTFWLGLGLIRFILYGASPVVGIARILIDEAIRMRIIIVLFVALLLVLVWMPLGMDPAEKLQYRIQSFLSWSLIVSSILLSIMTLLLSAWTITNEIEHRQIFLTLTKPVSRAQYLFGKFLGIIILNGLLLGVMGGGIYSFTMMLAIQPAMNEQDRKAVDHEVLVARKTALPQPSDQAQFQKQFEQQLDQLRRENPTYWGQPDEPASALAPMMQAAIYQRVKIDWFKMPPNHWQSFQFTNLQALKKTGQHIQLRLKPELIQESSDGFVYLEMRINDRPVPVPKLSDRTFHVLDISPEFIDVNGDMKIQMGNLKENQPTINFNTSDGLMVLYQVGRFEVNLAKALFILWIRLCFLTMLGLAVGSFLGFPVACLACMTIYLISAFSGFIMEALAGYAYLPTQKYAGYELAIWIIERIVQKFNEGKNWDIAKMLIRLFGHVILFFVPSLSDYDPTILISEGIYLPFKYLLKAILWVGIIWTGMLALFSYLMFKGRELARVVV